MDDVFFDCEFTGDLIGTFTVQVSASYDPVTNPSAVFIPVTLSPVPVTAGTPGQVGINMNFMGSNYIQIIYTNTSGTGVLNVWCNGKAL